MGQDQERREWVGIGNARDDLGSGLGMPGMGRDQECWEWVRIGIGNAGNGSRSDWEGRGWVRIGNARDGSGLRIMGSGLESGLRIPGNGLGWDWECWEWFGMGLGIQGMVWDRIGNSGKWFRMGLGILGIVWLMWGSK